MNDFIEARAKEEARYLVDNCSTIRQTAKHFGVSKSTVHLDVTKRLMKINKSLADEVKILLDINTEERHIRGGLSTHNKWAHVN